MVTGRPVVREVLNVLPGDHRADPGLPGARRGVRPPARDLGRDQPQPAARLPDADRSLLGLSFPAFVSAILLLLIFAIQLRWFPVISSGAGTSLAERVRDLALPAISLGLIMAAYITRVTRSSMLEVLGEDYVRTARAKGVPWTVIIWRHACATR